ncbi:oxidoreductase [[Actinomadura] parvosata subsp. kistnae]|uniref:Oxidoreductase n=2 Tax=Nonomuraea TaxID=83681 RepID=A0A1V0A1Z5_9ACTN|nr:MULTISPECIES: CBS domain-containing protein [unclassified Nonomuraea]AQZ64172.1 oxidoreductase [Nonomuraea sp. ATCC 55076]NJP94651.1 CBS domain-containing protein [Nonomuraea sp. FMUSA5-5]SPL87340.1 oxidoreductase [Actinomadura parvosata subsp. kistnae]
MARTVADVMTSHPATVEADQPVSVAASLMRDNDTGAVIVNDNGRIKGIVTDRDITVRVTADERGPDTPVRDACSPSVEAVGPDTSIDQAVQLMRTHAVRRLPVVEDGRAVGVVSLGDLAMERDPNSALADISAAEGNR